MKKISIKREQSQAGLSFAEREKFRPQVKNKLLLLLVLLMTAATGAMAQTETLADGSYYVKNGALSLYMAAGGEWGTHGIVNERGLDLIFTYNSGTKTYTIDSRLNSGNNHFLDTGLYMDGHSFGWTVEGENSFTISAILDGVKHYIAVDQNNKLVYTEDGTAENAQWTIIPKADNENAVLTAGLDAMKAATAENGVDATFLIACPGFNRNDKRNAEAWTVEANRLEMGGAGPEGNGCAESYNSTFTLSQTLSNAPAGVYTLTAQGFYKQNGSDNENLPYFYANDEKQTFKLLEDQVYNMLDAGPLFTQGKYTIDPITVEVAEDGALTIGAKLETNTTLWSCWDNFKLTYYGPLMYSVTLAEGTEDAANWTISPAEAAAGSPITATYSGEKKVKSVKAVKKAAVDPKLATPLTIEAITAGTIQVARPKEGMQYSLNGGAKTAVTTGDIDVAAGDKVQFYGNGTSITSSGDSSSSECTRITGSGLGFTCKVYGNIMSLVDEENFATAKTLSADYTFRRLFYNNTTLTDASGLLLPATQLAKYCYQQMFMGCTVLTAAPVLPAETLVDYCYYQMFQNCSKLATVTCLATSGIGQSGSTSNWLYYAGSQAQGTKTVYTVSTAEWSPDSSAGIPTGWTRVNVDN